LRRGSASSAAAASKRKGILSLSLSESLLCFFMDMDTGGGREEPKSSLVPVKTQQLVKKIRKRK
jgi:hypothetical protein